MQDVCVCWFEEVTYGLESAEDFVINTIIISFKLMVMIRQDEVN